MLNNSFKLIIIVFTSINYLSGFDRATKLKKAIDACKRKIEKATEAGDAKQVADLILLQGNLINKLYGDKGSLCFKSDNIAFLDEVHKHLEQAGNKLGIVTPVEKCIKPVNSKQKKDINCINLKKSISEIDKLNLNKSLSQAAKDNNSELIVKFVLAYADINNKCKTDRTPLMHAVFYANVEAVEILLKLRNIDVNVTNDKGFNALHYAVFKNDKIENRKKILKLLLPLIDVNSRTNKGWTPLHIASAHGNYWAAEILVELGKAKNNLRTRDNESVMDLVKYSWSELLRLKT